MSTEIAAAETIPLFDVRLDEHAIEAVATTLRSGWLTMGPRTRAFEEDFAELLGTRHAVAVSSGTAALHLAYLAAGIGPGDEVLVPSYTFVATVAAVVHCGAQPVFADILGPENLSLDPQEVVHELDRSPRIKAVSCVHFAGYPAAVDVLAELCAEREIALIEDAAHAPGATLQGRRLGTWGLAGAFSLFSNKILSVGEGGVLVTDDDTVAARARSLRSHAMSSGTWERHVGHAGGYDVEDVGFNYRIDEPRSALAHALLGRLPQDIEARRGLTRSYRERLGRHPGLIVPFTEESIADSCCYMMPILLRDGTQRERVRSGLRESHGIQTSVHFPPAHMFTAYRERCPGVTLPVTEALSASEITIPLFAHMQERQLERVVRALEAEV